MHDIEDVVINHNPVIVYAEPVYSVIAIRPFSQVSPSDFYNPDGMLHSMGNKAWPLYRAIMHKPPTIRYGNIRVVTKPEKIRWWLRCKLVKWGII